MRQTVSWLHRIKNLFNAGLHPLGIDVQRYRSVRTRPTKRSALALLRDAGFSPRTVFDVGVHRGGTPELYETFPAAKHVLVEPLREFENDIAAMIAELRDAEVVWAAASNREGTGTLEVAANLAGSSVVDRPEGRQVRTVPLITLDGLRERKGLPGPFLVKIDVDGEEISVLEGAERTLSETEVVVLESRLPDLRRRVAFLEEREFLLWDLVDVLYLDRCLWQVDLVFVHSRFAYAHACIRHERLDGVWENLVEP